MLNGESVVEAEPQLPYQRGQVVSQTEACYESAQFLAFVVTRTTDLSQ